MQTTMLVNPRKANSNNSAASSIQMDAKTSSHFTPPRKQFSRMQAPILPSYNPGLAGELPSQQRITFSSLPSSNADSGNA